MSIEPQVLQKILKSLLIHNLQQIWSQTFVLFLLIIITWLLLLFLLFLLLLLLLLLLLSSF